MTEVKKHARMHPCSRLWDVVGILYLLSSRCLSSVFSCCVRHEELGAHKGLGVEWQYSFGLIVLGIRAARSVEHETKQCQPKLATK